MQQSRQQTAVGGGSVTGEETPLHDLWRFLAVQFHEDWTHEHDDAWAAAEDFVVTWPAEEIVKVASSIDYLYSHFATAAGRFAAIPAARYVCSSADYDAWLLAVRARMGRAVAGDNSEPLTAPA